MARLEALTDDLQAEVVKPAERGQVRASEGSVRHVEVFRMGSVRTPILGRPRPLSGDRRAAARYTLNCDEPLLGPADSRRSLRCAGDVRRPPAGAAGERRI